MNQDVRQWLAEIKALQQQLAATQQELQEANNSANNWRRLYETEAQQRRTDTAFAQQTFATLQAELQQLRGGPPATVSSLPGSQAQIQQAVNQLQTVEELRAKLAEALLMQQRLQEDLDRLTQALNQEQSEHAQTRKSLTTALGDTIDLLTRERALRGAEKVETPTELGSDGVNNSNILAPKSPSLELPPLDQAQFPV